MRRCAGHASPFAWTVWVGGSEVGSEACRTGTTDWPHESQEACVDVKLLFPRQTPVHSYWDGQV